MKKWNRNVFRRHPLFFRRHFVFFRRAPLFFRRQPPKVRLSHRSPFQQLHFDHEKKSRNEFRLFSPMIISVIQVYPMHGKA